LLARARVLAQSGDDLDASRAREHAAANRARFRAASAN
jgi:hypothetical protein